MLNLSGCYGYPPTSPCDGDHAFAGIGEAKCAVEVGREEGVAQVGAIAGRPGCYALSCIRVCFQ